MAREITRAAYAIVDAISLLDFDLRVALASANVPLRILSNINKGSIYLIVCNDSKILIVTRLLKIHTRLNGCPKMFGLDHFVNFLKLFCYYCCLFCKSVEVQNRK